MRTRRELCGADRVPGQVQIREVRIADLPAIAELHRQAFPESVLGRLGSEAVRRSYAWQLDGPHELTALAGVVDGQIAGFLFGGVFRGSTIGFLRRDKWFLVGQVLRHPGVFVRGLGRDRHRSGPPAPRRPPSSARCREPCGRSGAFVRGAVDRRRPSRAGQRSRSPPHGRGHTAGPSRRLRGHAPFGASRQRAGGRVLSVARLGPGARTGPVSGRVACESGD